MAIKQQSGVASNPVIEIKNTANDATGGILKFINDKGAAGADDDVCGTIQFYGDDDNQDQVLFAQIQGTVADASNNTEGGKLTLSIASHDAGLESGLILADGSADGEVDITLGAGSASVVTIPGVLKVANDIILDDGGSIKETGGTAAITIDGDGNVTKIGQDSPSNGEFLKWDGSKAVWDSGGGGVSASSSNTFTAKQQIDLAAGNITPSIDGSHLHIEGSVTMTDNNTGGSGTASAYNQVSIESVTLAAANSSVTCTNASSLYIKGAPAAGTNMTLTNNYALFVDGGTTRLDGNVKIGTAAGSGADVYFYGAGAAAHVGLHWDADLNTEGTLVGGADDHGVDFKFFGETTGKYIQWDQSGDELVLASSSKISFHDASGGENIVASADGHLEINAGTTLDCTAPTIDLNANTTVTLDTPTVTITSSTSQRPILTVLNTNDDANGASIVLEKNPSTANNMQDGDVVGSIKFSAYDSGDNALECGMIQCVADDITAGSESSSLKFSVAELDGTLTSVISIQGDASTDGKASLLPVTDNKHDLGSSSLRWANLYTADLHLKNDRGDWTVIEEEEFLSLRNNKTGKCYKIDMTPLPEK